jgi:hypothetical protein
MLKKYLFLLFLFLSVHYSFSQKQYTLEGRIVNIKKSGISNANIIAKEITSEKIINYDISKIDGSFKIILITDNDKINIAFSCLGYKTVNKIINLEKNVISIDQIELSEDSIELSEVIIDAEKKGITKKGDTLIYNVKKYLNGTENSLKDLISNLPGMKINSNGKIEVNGNVISELLIDGENLYKNQHQFATENLNSKIVKSVEYYKNYTPYDQVKKDSTTNDTALNIIIKDEFKKKFKGYVLGENNLDDRYKVNTNAFNFSKKNKFSIIQSTNNLGELPITTLDYFTLIQNDEVKSESSVEIKSYESVPKFLKSGENVADKNNTFLNISNVYTPNKKFKINFFSILSQSHQTEISERYTKYNDSDLSINENSKIKEKSYFNITNLKGVYKPNLSTIFKYNSFLYIDNLSRNNISSNIINNNTSTIYHDNKIKNFKVANSFDFIKKYENSSFSTNTSFVEEHIDDNSSISSDQSFLNLNFNTPYLFKQNLDIIKKDFVIESKYSFKIFKSNNSFKLKYCKDFSDYKNYSETNLNYSNIFFSKEELLSQEFNSSLNISKKIKFSYGINNNFIKQRAYNNLSNKINFLGYNLNIEYFFKQNSILRFNNSLSQRLTTQEKLIENDYIRDYRTLVRNFNLKPNTLFPTNKITLNYLYTNTENNNFLIVNLDHNWKRKYEGINQIIENNYIIVENTICNKDYSTSFFIYSEKNFNDKPLTLTYNFDYNFGFQEFFINNLNSFYKSNYFSNSISLKSKFKKSIIHFNTGISTSLSFFNNNNLKNNNKTIQTFATLNGLFLKNFNWKINYSFNNFIVANTSNVINILSLNLRYSIPKSNWEYSINAHNIFNFNNPVFVSNQTSIGYESQLSNLNLKGYLNLGLKYKF